MIIKIMRQILIPFTFLALTSAAFAETTKSWQFSVYLDDKRIGHHHFTRIQNGPNHLIKSSAQFDVKLLFFTAYSYTHENSELWQGQCLTRMTAVTNDNGEELLVKGSADSSGFLVKTLDDSAKLPQCVMSFAYWDPAILEANRLLNAQTGEYIDVSVESFGKDLIDVQGKLTPAQHYRLIGENLQIDLWYSTDNQWLALESTTEGGRRISYRIQ